jgi:hypothetical protein
MLRTSAALSVLAISLCVPVPASATSACDSQCPIPTKLGEPVRLTSVPTSGGPETVWTGREIGLAWIDGRDGSRAVYFCRLDAAGNKISGDLRLSLPGHDLGPYDQPACGRGVSTG